MRELTEREEQEMIEKARAGDPEANYQMSFWALEQAAAEPEEDRWNRLAAKCLVRSAEAGYQPAQERMARLLREMDERERTLAASKTAFEPAQEEATKRFSPVQEKRVENASAGGKVTSRSSGAMGAGKTVVAKGKELLDKAAGLFSKGEEGAGSHASDDVVDTAKWKKMQLMCTIACIVLAFLIVLMIFSGREERIGKQEQAQVPAAATAEPLAATPSPSPEPYPDEETRARVEGALLDIFPAEEDYVEKPTAAVVDSSVGLRLRMGPATSYDQVVMMDDGAEIPVYAIRDGWALVLYNNESYGWCSTDYLDME